MLRQAIWQGIAKHRELALGLTFIGVAGWELMEVVALERPHGATGPLPLALHSIQIALVLVVTWTVIRAWQERSRYEDALARMVERAVMAQEEERRRIAYDVHDGIAQLIVSAKQHVDTARDLADVGPPRARHELARAGQRLEAAIVETRRVLRALRPSAVDSLGLADAMRRALDEAAGDAGWAARFVDELGDTPVPPAVETAAFRILQESLLNAARHANGTSVEVELGGRPGWLCLEVRDDGVGLRPEALSGRGLGLAGMRERARLLGGTCRIENRVGGGTAVSVALPLGPESPRAPRDD
jgi:signal transduction histidine kinase